MLRCSEEAFAACPTRHVCGTRESATFAEGSECDEFNRQVHDAPRTNEDRIHSARGRELAEVLYSINTADFCKELPECWRMLEEPGGIPDDKCIGCLEEWLQRKVEGDNK